jgi:holo-[acyl-carrier protein] synthase
MILGIGVDIIEVERIRGVHERFGDRFLTRFLCPTELAYCAGYRQPAPHWAARFAAKEAISKAFGTGIGSELGWLDMEVLRHPTGQPYAVLHGKGSTLLRERGGEALHLTLSHTAQHAVAMAVIERRSES